MRRKFYMSVNCIINKCKYSSELVKLELLESHCLPIILYAIESLNLKVVQVKQLNSWWNSVDRKIFGYNKWDSVKELIFMLGRLDLVHIVNLRRLMFIKRLMMSYNRVMSKLMYYYLHGPELQNLLNCSGAQLCWSMAKIKALTFVAFKECVSARASV